MFKINGWVSTQPVNSSAVLRLALLIRSRIAAKYSSLLFLASYIYKASPGNGGLPALSVGKERDREMLRLGPFLQQNVVDFRTD